MIPGVSGRDFVARALGGDQLAIERLLFEFDADLAKFIRRKIPADLRALIVPEDVLQVTYAEVFRDIATFDRPDPDLDALYCWVVGIAEHRLKDMIRTHRALKRGGGRLPVGALRHEALSSVTDLLDLVAVDEHTPISSVARREAVSALHVALAGLNDDRREALRLRYLEGLPVPEVAARMKRTPAAVYMLCFRGLRDLRAAMGQASAYLSSRR
jgi:RNA polymerase sigma-70 factor (ECF subfamily)